MQRRALQVIFGIGARVMSENKPGEFRRTCSGREHQRRAAGGISGIDIGAGIEQRRRHVGASVTQRGEQRRQFCSAMGIRLYPGIKQGPDHAWFVAVRSKPKHAVAVAVGNCGIGTVRK